MGYLFQDTQQYLSGELLVLLRQDPRAWIEVIFLREQLLHCPHCTTKIDFPQHFDHSCNVRTTLKKCKIKAGIQ